MPRILVPRGVTVTGRRMIRNIRATAGVCIYFWLLVDPRARTKGRRTCTLRYGKVCATPANLRNEHHVLRGLSVESPRSWKDPKWIEWRRELSRRKLLRQFHTPRTLCRAIYGAPKRLAHSGECSSGNFGVVLLVPLLRRSPSGTGALSYFSMKDALRGAHWNPYHRRNFAIRSSRSPRSTIDP